jgi:hypothetical protein
MFVTYEKPNKKPEQPKANTLAHDQQSFPDADLETPELLAKGPFCHKHVRSD